MFFNVIDHLKRQIDRLFKGKADLVDGKVPEDQLPERPTDTVTWDDVEGKPTEFPPAEHGHPDIAESVEDLRTTKADATEVTALGARVGVAEAGIEGLRGSLGAMEQTVDEADMRSQNAYAQARDAVEKAEAAAFSAGNAYTTAMAADSKATDAVSKATDAVSKAAAAKSIAEDAQVSADDAVGYAELAVRTAESKLDSDGTAANSAQLGGVAASEYARKTDIPKRVSNDTDTVRIDGEGNVYDVTNTPTDNYITVTYNTGTVRRYNYNRLSSSYYEYKWTGGNEYLNYRQSDGRISNQSGLQIAIANSGVDPLDDEQIVVSSISATSITSIVHTPQKSAKTETKTDRLTRESQLTEFVKASEIANAKSAAGTSVTLTDRDCATVDYAAGLTLAFANASGLRQFEILIKGCVADGSIGVPSKVYRGASDAFDLEEGDNHLSFAEQADGSFVVHRMFANTITIGG